MIDSELVPWGKGEKQPGEGDEIDLKPYAYKESERAELCIQQLFKCSYLVFMTGLLAFTMCWVKSSVRHGVPIEEWANELMHAAG